MMSRRSPPTQAFACALAVGLLFADLPAIAADLPTRKAPPASEFVTKGVWGAIAFSPGTGRHGFFWGADTRLEAEEIALRHCANAGGGDCGVVSTFHNHRRSVYDAQQAPHCGALSVSQSQPVGAPVARWGAASAASRADAEALALTHCGDTAACVIREWVCT